MFRRSSVLVLCAGLLAAGCGGGSSAPRPARVSRLSGTITVFAAASLTKAFTEIGHAFEAAHPGTKVVFSFGSSSGLAQQIVSGAPADLFASASTKNMAQVTAAGDASNPATFASNVAEVAAAPGSAVASLADLAKPGVKVALCQPQVPCGELALKVLRNAGVTVKPVTQGLDVKSTLAYVTSGQVDAAVVYVTDVLAAGGKVRGIAIPAAVNASTAYVIAPVKAGRNPALTGAFGEYVLSAPGQDALARAGFQVP